MQQAYERCKEARTALHALDNSRCMECTEDRAGIVWERWVLLFQTANGGSNVSVVLFATPHWWDLYAPITRDPDITATLDALRKLSRGE